MRRADVDEWIAGGAAGMDALMTASTRCARGRLVCIVCQRCGALADCDHLGRDADQLAA